MDAFTRRIDPEDSFDVGDDLTNSFDLTSTSMSSSSSSFGTQSPGGTGGSEVEGEATNPRHSSQSSQLDQQQQQQQPHVEYKLQRRPLYEAPEFVRRLNVFEEVDIGGAVTFECQVRAFPRPLIKWYKDDVEVTSFPLTMQSDVSDDGSSATDRRVHSEDLTGKDSSTEGLLRLVIHDARKDDEGAYRCKAENEEGVAATTGYLSVTGPASNQSASNGSPQASPRVNSVSSPPLLRAITEQQSMEEREAATYVEEDDDVENNVDDGVDNEMVRSVPDVPILSTVGDWSMYAEYLQKALDDDSVDLVAADGQQHTTDTGSGSDTSCELDDFADELKVDVSKANLPVAGDAACESTNNDETGGTTGTGNELENDDYVNVGVSMINVVVVEDHNPNESAVAAAVIIGSVAEEETAINEPTMQSTTCDEVAETEEELTPSIVFVGPTLSAAEQGDGKCFVSGAAFDQQPVPVSSSTPGAGDSGDDGADGNRNNSFFETQPLDINRDDVDVELNGVEDHHPLAEPDIEQPMELDVDIRSKSSDVQAVETSDTLEFRTVSEKAAENDESIQSKDDNRRANASTAAAVGGGTRKSVSTPFSFGGLLRDILPVKPDKATSAVDNSSPYQPASDFGENRQGTVELSANSSSGLVDPGKMRSTEPAESTPPQHQPKMDADGMIELSWSRIYDWYIGWFEMPWIIYAILAIVFTLAATAGDVDPAWVVITVVVASMLAFRLFPVPIKSTEIHK